MGGGRNFGGRTLLLVFGLLHASSLGKFNNHQMESSFVQLALAQFFSAPII